MSSSTALIVGASRGIGLGLTRELLERGRQVTGTVRDPDAALPLLLIVRHISLQTTDRIWRQQPSSSWRPGMDQQAPLRAG